MDRDILNQCLNIRYVKLHFTLVFPKGGLVPKTKASALRGGMGEMLLRANCISNRKCDCCGFAQECIVQRTMYSKFEQKPAFVTSGDSVGYVVECEDYRDRLDPGDEVQMNLILFGKTIVYFNLYMQALFALGQIGLGKEKVPFYIASVTNSRGRSILEGSNIYMKEYTVSTVAEYVDYRMKQLRSGASENSAANIKIRFRTPWTQKYEGEFLRCFRMDAMMKAIQRRVYIIDCFEGIEEGEALYHSELENPELFEEDVIDDSVSRFSFRKNQKMNLKGIRGTIICGQMEEDTLRLLIAGELLHIGKNTSFGFGRYFVKDATQEARRR